jgi:hypothetical protein
MFDEIKNHAANERQVRAAGLESYVEHLMRTLQQADEPEDEAAGAAVAVASPTAPPAGPQ